jgi:L,D-peptidoglycan transpeptidase YkuD (ErfK/YbiS/YcfS/YnhG family)
MRRRLLLSVVALGLVYVALLGASAAWARREVPHAACPTVGVVVQVDTAAHVLSLCRAGREDASFRVALGRGGVDKKAEGDGRTPRGRYPLDPARSSGRYHLFLPVGYPTSDQAKRGFTGSAIGVHGPHVAFVWLGSATAWPDWTLGCIALGTRQQVERVSRWVNENGAAEILIV